MPQQTICNLLFCYQGLWQTWLELVAWQGWGTITRCQRCWRTNGKMRSGGHWQDCQGHWPEQPKFQCPLSQCLHQESEGRHVPEKQHQLQSKGLPLKWRLNLTAPGSSFQHQLELQSNQWGSGMVQGSQNWQSFWSRGQAGPSAWSAGLWQCRPGRCTRWPGRQQGEWYQLLYQSGQYQQTGTCRVCSQLYFG